jgi:hypothetical protein
MSEERDTLEDLRNVSLAEVASADDEPELLDDDDVAELDDDTGLGDLDDEPEEEAQDDERALRGRMQQQEQELARYRQAHAQAVALQQAQAAQAQFQRISELSYEQQNAYFVQQSQRLVAQQAFQARDAEDRASFQKLVRDQRLPARYATEVEALRQQAIAGGADISREWCLKAILGHERLTGKSGPQAGGSARQATPRSRRSQELADEKKLKSITVGEFLNRY